MSRSRKILEAALAIFLTAHLTNSYILLTANLEDVQAIAKQLVHSPVADQLKNIWRRASVQFNQQVQRAQKRTNGQQDSHSEEELPPRDNQQPSGHYSDARMIDRRSQLNSPDTTESWLTKNASYYLSSIKKIMDGI